MDAILNKYVAQDADLKDKLVGAAFVAVDKNGITSQGSSGKIAIGSNTAFATDTFTAVASLTKLITIVCVMQLVEIGKANIDDDVRKILPELEALQILQGFDAEGQPILVDTDVVITLRMLLNHTAGLGYDTADPDLIRWAQATGRKVNFLSFTMEGFTLPFKHVPGQGWTYGTATDWAGIYLTRITDMSLGEYMKKYVFDIVGMADTGFRKAEHPQTAARTAPATFRSPDGIPQEFKLPVPDDQPVESGGAGIYSTAADYAKFLQGLLSGKFVKDATLDEMFRDQLNDVQKLALQSQADAEHQMKYCPDLPLGTKISSGLGGLLSLEDVPGRRGKGTMSWAGAYNSRWWLDRQKGIAGVMVVNCLPWGDATSGAMFTELEEAVYASIQ